MMPDFFDFPQWGDEYDSGGGLSDYGYGPGESPQSYQSPGDPYSNWGGGAGGDGSNGSFDSGGSGLLSGLANSGGSLTSMLKSLGILGANGQINYPALLAMLGAGGAVYGANNVSGAIKQGGAEIKAAADRGAQEATGLIQGAREGYKPYQAAGTDALAKLQAMVGQGLASKYQSTAAPVKNDLQDYVALAKLARGGR